MANVTAAMVKELRDATGAGSRAQSAGGKHRHGPEFHRE